jgi:outer membrane protein TolC
MFDALGPAPQACRCARRRQAISSASASSLIDLMDAERTQLIAQQSLVQGRADLLKDFVSLQKSLGLGWANSSQMQSTPST